MLFSVFWWISKATVNQAIGKELQSAGHNVDVAEMKTVTSVEGYNAVVIGAPLYMGSMVKDVAKFVGRYRDQLTKLPVAAFAVGIAPKDPNPEAVVTAMETLKKSLSPLTPVEMIIFAGKLDPAKINFVMRKFLEMAKIPSGDFRDWNAISAWAKELPGKMGI